MSKAGFIHMALAILSILNSHCSVIRESGFNFENEVFMKELQAFQEEKTDLNLEKIVSKDVSVSSESQNYDEDNIFYKHDAVDMDGYDNIPATNGFKFSDAIPFPTANGFKFPDAIPIPTVPPKFRGMPDEDMRKYANGFRFPDAIHFPTVPPKFRGMPDEDFRKYEDVFNFSHEIPYPTVMPLEPVGHRWWQSRYTRISFPILAIIIVVSIILKCAYPRQRVVLVAAVLKKREEEGDQSNLISAKQDV